jgi:hypothetical protein
MIPKFTFFRKKTLHHRTQSQATGKHRIHQKLVKLIQKILQINIFFISKFTLTQIKLNKFYLNIKIFILISVSYA